MSLLMDALKKAEREKKETAERVQEAQPDDSRKDPLLDRTLTQELIIEGDLSQPASPDLADENQTKIDDAYREGLTLSPIDAQAFSAVSTDSIDKGLSLLDIIESVPPSPLSSAEDEVSVTNDMEFNVKEEMVSGISQDLDETLESSSTDYQVDEVPVAPEAENTIQVAQEFQDTAAFEKSTNDYEYLGSTVSAVQLAQDIGIDSPTPVAAQTVFTAISTKSGNQVLQWGTLVVLCLVIAVSLSLFVFNYTVPLERSIKSPLIAKDIETQSQPVLVIDIPNALVSTKIDSSLFTGEITDVIEKENDAVTEVEQAGSEDQITNENSTDQVVMAQEKIWYPAEDDVSEVDYFVAETSEEAELTLPEKIELEPKLIKISRSTSTDKSKELINRAYEEYIKGDYEAAEKNYRIILNNLPGNRDALLGLAAIEIRKGHVRNAYINYLEVLRLYPGDSVAEAALINFKHDGNYVKNESILKIFIQKEPDNSFLYYSLGHLHALEKHWPEAQQSFFNAHRIETTNPDYAFNLAVSLDHIGQQKSAIDYYNIALELVDNSTVSFATHSFDTSIVISRINELTRAESSLADLQ